MTHRSFPSSFPLPESQSSGIRNIVGSVNSGPVPRRVDQHFAIGMATGGV